MYAHNYLSTIFIIRLFICTTGFLNKIVNNETLLSDHCHPLYNVKYEFRMVTYVSCRVYSILELSVILYIFIVGRFQLYLLPKFLTICVHKANCKV